MSMSVFAVLAMAALGGGVAAGASALIVVAVAWLVIIALANAIRLLGELLESVDERGGPYADDGANHL
jgi:hypothetical protein